MLTIKWTDRDGYERIVEGEDVSAKMDGKQAAMVCFRSDKGHPRLIDFPTTVYVMSAAGATVGKYVVCPESVGVSHEDSDGWIEWNGKGDRPGHDVNVETRWSDGEVTGPELSDEWRWTHLPNTHNLIAYRVVP